MSTYETPKYLSVLSYKTGENETVRVLHIARDAFTEDAFGLLIEALVNKNLLTAKEVALICNTGFEDTSKFVDEEGGDIPAPRPVNIPPEWVRDAASGAWRQPTPDENWNYWFVTPEPKKTP